MVKILNLGSLLAATCRELSGSQREETFTLSADGEEFTSDDPAVIARLVFGPEGAGELIGAAPEKVLAACEAELPLPLHVPLLDHV